MPRFIFFLIFFAVALLQAQHFTGGARSSGLGGSSSTFFDVWSVQNNQAGLGQIHQVEAGVYYENRFQLKELTYSAMAFAIPLKKNGAFGVSYNTFGYSAFRQSKAGLAYGMRFGENFSAGMQLDYFSTGIQDAMNVYGRRSVFTGELGFIARLTPQVSVSGHLFNIVRARLASYNNEVLPMVLKGGLQYKVSEKVLMVFETEKQTYADINLKGGIEYLPAKDVYLRTGASSFPRQMSFGAGFLYKGLKVDLASTWHSVLGISPQISLGYIFSKRGTTEIKSP